MSANMTRALLDAIEDEGLSEDEKRRFRALVYRAGSMLGVSECKQRMRSEFAAELLRRHRGDRPRVADALIAAFDISKSTAYEDIGRALQTVQK